MQKTIILLAAFSWILQSACVTSLHPLATYDRSTTDARLTGKWKKNDGQEFLIQPILTSDYYKSGQSSSMAGDKIPFTIKEKKDSLLLTRSYIVEYSKENGHYAMLVNFVRLSDQLFMSCLPIEASYTTPEGGGELDISGSMHGYTIAKVQWQNSNMLKLDFIDGGFLYEQLKAGRMKLKHESDELYDTFLITASTNELQQFLEKYGNDDRFYDKENSVTLIRKS